MEDLLISEEIVTINDVTDEYDVEVVAEEIILIGPEVTMLKGDTGTSVPPAGQNFVTDAEKTVIENTSGTNTGDQDLSGLVPKQSGVISGQRDRAPKTTCADAVQDVTFNFNAGNSRYVDASAITGGKAVTLLATNFPTAEIEAGVDPQVVYTLYIKIGAARPSLTAPAGWAVGTLLSAITQNKTSVFTVDFVGTDAPTLTLLREY